jgi:hypothetical protein
MFSAHRRRTILVAIALAVVVAGVVGSVVSSASSTRAPRSHHSISVSLRRHFSVLHAVRAATADQSGALPAGVTQELTEAGSMSAQYRLEPAQAQHVTLGDGSGAWVIPGSAGVCLVVQTPPATESGVVCGSVASANAGTVMLVRSDPSTGAKTVSGLAPNGSTAVTLTGDDGSTTQVPVTDNVYETSITAKPKSITVRDAQGKPTITSLPGQ